MRQPGEPAYLGRDAAWLQNGDIRDKSRVRCRLARRKRARFTSRTAQLIALQVQAHQLGEPADVGRDRACQACPAPKKKHVTGRRVRQMRPIEVYGHTLTGQLIVAEVQLLQLRQLSDLGRDGVLKMEVRSQTTSTIGSVTNACKRRVRGTHWPAGCAGG